MAQRKILCVCKGNGDRSPGMAAVLQMFLDQRHIDVVCESVGILEIADQGGPASPQGIVAARQIGIDLTKHQRRWFKSLDLTEYILIVCVDETVAARLLDRDVDMKLLYSANIPNPWPNTFQEDHDRTLAEILVAMLKVMRHYFPTDGDMLIV